MTPGRGGLLWWAVMIGCALVVRTSFAQAPRVPYKVGTWDPTPRTSCYGILGEVAKPGVYQSTSGSVTIQELVQQAGGVTATSSPSVRVIRQARIAQNLFFTSDGRDLLQPNDIVVLDLPANARTTPSVVWLAMSGVANRPVVVPIKPQFASLNNIVVNMLEQSRELVTRVQILSPPRMPVTRADATLPSGTVLIFDRGLLVEQNLPSFPEALPFVSIDAKRLRESSPWASQENVPPPPVRDRVQATPVPFSTLSDERTPAAPASMPAPGTRFYIPPEQPMTADTQIAIPPVDPKLAADERTEILPAPEPPDQDVPTAKHSSVSLWQLFGISGTIACLIGIAIATRKYLDHSINTAPAGATTVGAASRAAPEQRATPITEPVRIDAPHHHPAAPITAARFVTPAAAPSTPDPDDLDHLLTGSIPIVTEPVQFPSRFPLQRRLDRPASVFRLDQGQTQPPAPHQPQPIKQPQYQAVAIDTAASGIPKPHFMSRESRVENREPEKKTETIPTTQTTVARALERLHGGRS